MLAFLSDGSLNQHARPRRVRNHLKIQTVSRSVTRHEDIDQLLETAQGRFLNVQ